MPGRRDARDPRSPDPDLRIAACSVDDPEAAALVAEAETELCARYGVTSIGHLHAADFEPGAGGAFVVAWLGGRAVGCGGIRRLDDEAAELKRLYVAPAGRRRGVARAVLAHLHEVATAAGYLVLRLETGTEQPEAVALYRSAGYRAIGAFGEHGHDRRSRYFGIDVPGSAPTRHSAAATRTPGGAAGGVSGGAAGGASGGAAGGASGDAEEKPARPPAATGRPRPEA